MHTEIKNCVYEHRTAAGVTQEDLAEKTGVSRQTIIAIEKGHYTPSVMLALRLAHYFKKPVEALFTIRHEK